MRTSSCFGRDSYHTYSFISAACVLTTFRAIGQAPRRELFPQFRITHHRFSRIPPGLKSSQLILIERTTPPLSELWKNCFRARTVKDSNAPRMGSYPPDLKDPAVTRNRLTYVRQCFCVHCYRLYFLTMSLAAGLHSAYSLFCPAGSSKTIPLFCETFAW